MQRPSLHLLPERASRRRARMRLRGTAIPLLAPRRRQPREESEARAPEASQQHLRRDLPAADLDARRVREAGGPRDEASYACSCGYRFAAAVSTSVECPHCGAGQAW